MNPAITKLPGIPRPPSDVSPALRIYLEALAEAIDIRLGRRGDPVDRAVTLRELINSGLAKELQSRPFDPNSSGDNPGFASSTSAVVTEVPLQPTGFTAQGAYSVINLVWDFANYSTHAATEIWAHSSDVLGDAEPVGVSVGRTYLDAVGGGVTRYYWIRHINTAGVAGPYNASAGTVATTVPDVENLLAVLGAAITEGELATALSARIDTFQNLTEVNGNITNRGYQTLANVNNYVNNLGFQTAGNVNTLIDNNTNGFQTADNVNGLIDGNSNGFQTSTDVNNALATAVVGVRGRILVWLASGEYEVNEVVRDNAGYLFVCIVAVTATTNDTLPTSFASPTTHWKLYGNMSSLEDSASKITQINLIDSNSTSAAAQAIVGINSVLFDSNGNAVVSATNLSTMKTSLLYANGVARATAQQIDFLSTTYTNPETGVANNVSMQQALETSADNVSGLRGQYSVKIDTNGYVAGFGLATTTSLAGVSTSEFAIRADRFALLNATAAAAYNAWVSGANYVIGDIVTYGGLLFQSKQVHNNAFAPSAATTNANGTVNQTLFFWDCLSTPFAVQTVGATVSNGAGGTVYIPAGVYIRSANIANASITSAQIVSINAATITTGTLDVTNRITAGTIDARKLVIGGSVVTSEARASDGKHFLKIADTSITTALIGDAQISTLKVAGNAVTVQTIANQAAASQTFAFGNSTIWPDIVSATFDPAGGGYVATYTGQMNLTDDTRVAFRIVTGPTYATATTVVKSWVTGMRADNGTSVEGEMSSVMTHGASSTGSLNTSTPITIRVQGQWQGGGAATVSNGALSIDGSKR
tara:strand:- start:90 stop:2546 length:2457 start_codon:yes stop_codon:yes gene_type:complete